MDAEPYFALVSSNPFSRLLDKDDEIQAQLWPPGQILL